MSRRLKSLRSLMERTIMLSSISGLVVVLVSAFLISYFNARSDRQKQQSLIHRTIGEFILPSLRVSDYAEVRKVLGTLTRGNELTGIITREGDVLLSDYGQLPELKHLADLPLGEVNCATINKRLVGQLRAGTLASCTEIGDGGTARDIKPLAIIVTLNSDRFYSFIPSLFLPLLLIGFVAIALIFFSFRWVFAKRVVKPFENLVEHLRRQTNSPLVHVDGPEQSETAPKEFIELESGFNSLVTAAQREHEQAKNLEKSNALYELSRQVAHDIRSPLAALNVEINEAQDSIPEGSRRRLALVASRIKEIAEKLLTAHQAKTASSMPSEKLDVYALELLVADILAEKTLEYADRQVRIEMECAHTSTSPAALIDPVEFKRVLSNLINNAIEALKDRSPIRVYVSTKGRQVEIRIMDSGRGIPPEILPKLMQQGASYGKKGGNGIGLFHARETLERWGGELEIASKLGVGTELRLLLPLRRTPPWLATSIRVVKDATIVILDDDPTMHAFWEKRLAAFSDRVISFRDPEKLTEWFALDPRARRAQFLFDQDLGTCGKIGTQLIEELHLSGRATLVTGSVIDNELLARTNRLGIQILPKLFAPRVPIIDEGCYGEETSAQIFEFFNEVKQEVT